MALRVIVAVFIREVILRIVLDLQHYAISIAWYATIIVVMTVFQRRVLMPRNKRLFSEIQEIINEANNHNSQLTS
mgnify:CR=1 FL=1